MRTAHWIACSLMVALMLAAGCTYAHSQHQAKAAEDANTLNYLPDASLVVPPLNVVPMAAYWGA